MHKQTPRTAAGPAPLPFYRISQRQHRSGQPHKPIRLRGDTPEARGTLAEPNPAAHQRRLASGRAAERAHNAQALGGRGRKAVELGTDFGADFDVDAGVDFESRPRQRLGADARSAGSPAEKRVESAPHAEQHRESEESIGAERGRN